VYVTLVGIQIFRIIRTVVVAVPVTASWLAASVTAAARGTLWLHLQQLRLQLLCINCLYTLDILYLIAGRVGVE